MQTIIKMSTMSTRENLSLLARRNLRTGRTGTLLAGPTKGKWFWSCWTNWAALLLGWEDGFCLLSSSLSSPLSSFGLNESVTSPVRLASTNSVSRKGAAPANQGRPALLRNAYFVFSAEIPEYCLDWRSSSPCLDGHDRSRFRTACLTRLPVMSCSLRVYASQRAP